MQRRPEFSFPGSSPARGQQDRALPPRPPVNMVAPRRDEEEIRWLQASRQGSPDYSSGTPSPPLWAHHSSHEHQHQQHHRMYPASTGSSPSRAQAIAGYRREMLDLVRGLPESAYELSLRDIVEHARPSSSSSPPPLPTPPPPLPPPPSSHADAAVAPPRRGHEPATAAAVDEKQSGGKKQGRRKQRAAAARSRSLERSVSLDTGLLIRFFVPLAIRGGKKKVSPKPDASKDAKKKKNEKKTKKKQGTNKDGRKQDEEWWTKSEFSEASAGTSSRTSSTGSSNDSVRNGAGNGNPRAPVRSKSRKRNGCYAFFRAHKSRNGVSQD